MYFQPHRILLPSNNIGKLYFFQKHTRFTCVICWSVFWYLTNNTVCMVVCFRRHILPSLLLLLMPATNFCSLHSHVLHTCTSEFPSPVCLVGEVRPGPEATDRAVSHSLQGGISNSLLLPCQITKLPRSRERNFLLCCFSSSPNLAVSHAKLSF